jgi:hypothetical protein
MRPRELSILLALLALPALAAQEPVASSSADAKLGRANFRHDVLLRESDEDASALAASSRASFPLPPGGHELELQPTSSTPYDRYFGSVRSVIASLEPHGTNMARACHLMKVGHSFEYVSRDPYKPDPPKLTEVQHSGDCKSKALWLYDNLADAGALFVIGKAEKSLRTSHAWVYWRCDGRWWILDCTDRADPIAADTVSADRYVPYYSFGKLGTYRHAATRVNAAAVNAAMAANATPVTSPSGQKKPH